MGLLFSKRYLSTLSALQAYCLFKPGHTICVTYSDQVNTSGDPGGMETVCAPFYAPKCCETVGCIKGAEQDSV